MQHDKRHCAECGEQVSGPFCSNCGTRTAVGATAGANTSGAFFDEEPTRLGADRAADQPYNGYASDDADEYGGGVPPVEPAATSSARPAKTNQMLVALIAVVALAVVGMLGYLFTNGRGDDKADPPPVSDSSTSAPTKSTSSSTSSSTTQSSTSSPDPSTTQGNSNGGNNGGGGAPAPAPSQTTEEPAPAPAPSPSTTGVSELPGLVKTTSMGGSDYAMTREGNTVTVWRAGSEGASRIGSFTLRGGGGSNGLDFINLPGCSAPVVAWNAASASGSAAYGYDGSGYQAYVGSSSGSMSPSGGSPSSYGVNAYNGMLEIRDSSKQKARGSGNHFDSCESASPDVLHMVSGG